MYFDNISNSLTLKNEYRRLAKIYHPDCNGDEYCMKMINDEYETKFKELEKDNYSGEDKEFLNEDIKNFLKIIQGTLMYTNINIEIIGSWIWISGNTYPFRKELKSLGMGWSNNKKAWYWHQGNYKKYNHKKDYTLEDIRNMHGSTKINRNKYKSHKIGIAI